MRAGIVRVEQLWLQRPGERASWFSAIDSLEGAGSLADTFAGRSSYLDYLGWLSAETVEQQRLGFERISKGWALGSTEFKVALLTDEKNRNAVLEMGTAETTEARELAWAEEVGRLKAQLDVGPVVTDVKSADWKAAVAAVMKQRTTVSNRWLAKHLDMGSMFTVSRMTAECRAGQRAIVPYRRLTAKSKA